MVAILNLVPPINNNYETYFPLIELHEHSSQISIIFMEYFISYPVKKRSDFLMLSFDLIIELYSHGHYSNNM